MTRLNRALAIISVLCGFTACGPDGGGASTEGADLIRSLMTFVSSR